MFPILATIVLGVMLATSTTTETYIRPLENYTVPELIEHYSAIYNIDGEMLLKIAKCESKLNPSAINYNDGGEGKHSVGVMQFQESTFLNWEKKLGENLNYNSAHDQIKLASFMFSKNQQGQWSCYKMVK